MRDTTTLPDGTVGFLPHRLNRQPVVVRGLTADELWVCAGLFGVIGLALGIAIAVLTGLIAMAPTMVLVMIALGIFVGGSILRRQKRGRPDTWLYRQIQWQMRVYIPVLAPYTGGDTLIVRSGHWTTRRLRRLAFRHRDAP